MEVQPSGWYEANLRNKVDAGVFALNQGNGAGCCVRLVSLIGMKGAKMWLAFTPLGEQLGLK